MKEYIMSRNPLFIREGLSTWVKKITPTETWWGRNPLFIREGLSTDEDFSIIWLNGKLSRNPLFIREGLSTNR